MILLLITRPLAFQQLIIEKNKTLGNEGLKNENEMNVNQIYIINKYLHNVNGQNQYLQTKNEIQKA
jgi:hypothetical protein